MLFEVFIILGKVTGYFFQKTLNAVLIVTRIKMKRFLSEKFLSPFMIISLPVDILQLSRISLPNISETIAFKIQYFKC